MKTFFVCSSFCRDFNRVNLMVTHVWLVGYSSKNEGGGRKDEAGGSGVATLRERRQR